MVSTRKSAGSRRSGVAKLAVVLIAVLTQSACAMRGMTGGPIAPLADLYSRNMIVAGPTLSGNLIGCGVGVAFALALRPIARASGDDDDAVMLYAIMVPSYAGGFALGTPFLPFSFLAPPTS